MPAPAILLFLGLLTMPVIAVEAPTHLRCEFLENPLGMDCLAPRLSWWLTDARRGAGQSAYRILVASDPAILAADRGDVWDSGKVSSRLSHLVPYAGPALRAFQDCHWKVQTWDQNGKASPWSGPARWSMGILGTNDWAGARWIRMAEDVAPLPKPLDGFKGYHSVPSKEPDSIAWVQVDLGAVHPIERVDLHPVNDAGIAGIGFPIRYRVEAANDATFATPILIVDRSTNDQPNPGPAVEKIVVPAGVTGRYVRVTATQLSAYKGSFSFRLGRMGVFGGGRNLAIGAVVTAKDSIEDERSGWSTKALTVFAGFTPAEDDRSCLPVFRKAIHVAKPLRRAMAYICGLGHQEVLVDGARIGNRLLDPPWTQYSKTCGYITYDLTERLQPGKHALGIMLGNGMYNIPGGRYTKIRQTFGQPQLIALVRLEYTDGSVENLISDEQWRYIRGPVVFSCVYGGEDHDLRRLPVGWCEPVFDAAGWKTAVASSGPKGTLKWICQEPIRATDRFRPKSMKQDKNCVFIDFGQKCALMPVLRMSGPAGAKVRISTGEGPNGGGMGGLRYQCTLAGRGEEEFRPRFMSWGSRSVQVEGATLDGTGGTVRVLGAEGWALRCSADAVGTFECSDPTINAIDHIITWAVHSNFQHVLTDCPHREKLGWLEVSHLMAPSILARFGAAAFYRKIQNDMADVQQTDGMVPTVAPYVPCGGAFGDSPEWGSAFIINPGLSWQWTGDRSNLDQHYPAMCRYVEYLTRRAKDGILAYGLGDWMPIEKTPMPIVATATLYHDLDLMARYARLLGKNDDAARFREQAARVAEAFDKTFWKDDTTGYGEGSQCAQAMPLFFGLAKPERRAAATARLIADARAKKRATGGDVGNRYILLALAEAGEHELVLNSTVSGSGAYIPQAQQALTGGRTTLAEGWGGGDSQNHCMLGHVQEWLFGFLAGIRPDPDQPGLAQVLIEPRPVGAVTWVKAHHDGPYGRIAIHWRRQDGTLDVDCTVPPNSSARLRLPTSDPASVTEGGQPPATAWQAVPVSGGVQFRLPSGSYRFRCALPAIR
jgi:hypothetical protein